MATPKYRIKKTSENKYIIEKYLWRWRWWCTWSYDTWYYWVPVGYKTLKSAKKIIEKDMLKTNAKVVYIYHKA